MEHIENKDVMNILLSNSCKGPSSEYSGYDEFVIDLHCSSYMVIARLKSKETYMVGELEVFDYEIKKVSKYVDF